MLTGFLTSIVVFFHQVRWSCSDPFARHLGETEEFLYAAAFMLIREGR